MDEILNVPLRSAKGVDYRKLRDLLKAGNWHDADMETESAMLHVKSADYFGFAFLAQRLVECDRQTP